MIRSFEPGEDWYWDYAREEYYVRPDGNADLAPPVSRPAGQSVPGPKERVPKDWMAQLQRRRG